MQIPLYRFLASILSYSLVTSLSNNRRKVMSTGRVFP